MKKNKKTRNKPAILPSNQREPQSKTKQVLHILAAVAFLYAFLVAVKSMGMSFKLFGRGFEETLIRETTNPFIGLFVGVLATSIVQSSSTTTAMVVAFVASGTLTIETAVPIVMGANIGTTVTAVLVAFVHVTRRNEFEKAFAAATVQEFFKILTVMVLLPLELTTGLLRKSAAAITHLFVGSSPDLSFAGPLSFIVGPVAKSLKSTCCYLGSPWHGVLLLTVSVIVLAFSLYMLTRIMKTIAMSGAEKSLTKALNRSPLVGFLAGLIITAIIQSSSVTTSLMVPMAAAGLLSVEHVFTVTAGATVGTTVTALLASLAGNAAGLTIAFVHLLFNVGGILLFYLFPYPRKIPVYLAKGMGRIGKRSPTAAIAFVAGLFFILPGLLIFFWNL